MIEPRVALAFAVHASPGVYALLIGSGVSRAAGVPTGYEVLWSLVERLAVAMDDSSGDDPLAWYTERFREAPTYSRLLERLAPTAAERRSVLARYFEPNDDDKAEGRKSPTAAHRAVAALVGSGHIKVLVTTNFDQLLELAIKDAGVTPQVLSTADDVIGAIPLQFAPCTVVKVNGDYLDTRIRNTEQELDDYEPPLRELLARIFDEYGLVRLCQIAPRADGKRD
jgi:hypothetical protein